MACRQVPTYNGVTGSGQSGGGGYATEAECLQACQEGACCEGTSCTVRPQCQCQGAGQVFKGVGTTCAGNPCGCCCVNGTADATKTEQQCTADGGAWKSYLCNSSAPSSVLLTLSLSNYTTTFGAGSPFGAGVWDFDFSCIKTSYVLTRKTQGLYNSLNPEANLSVMISTTGGFGSNYSATVCGCSVPLLNNGAFYSNTNTVAIQRNSQLQTRNCAPSSIGLGNSFGFLLMTGGQNGSQLQQAVEVAGFCTGQYSVSGAVWGPNNVQCGTFTIGNPLP